MLEILAPAGNAECAAAAINNGANAIYLGYSSFSARQSADNFDGEALRTVIQNAHLNDVKVYVAMNTIVKDSEVEDFIKTMLFVWSLGADAIILQDVLLGKVLHRQYPEIVLHLSTQAGVCNVNGAKFAKECGFSRVILARETPLAEIEKIAKIIETEVFVQGALCTCFSGQCYFSSFAGGNSGNRGRCKQPCRKQYSYNRKGFEEKTYALSLSDLCVGEDVEKLMQAGVVSFKIEGRMRRAEYVAAAVRYYRILLDKKSGEQAALSDLKRTYNRGNYTRGLAFGQDKRFLSPVIQGHLGEKVGVIKVINGKFLVESQWKPRQGDSFKILRDGHEVGGAWFSKQEGKHFVLSSKVRLKNGDSVFVTTDTAVNERVLQAQKKSVLSISLQFHENDYAFAKCGDVEYTSAELLQSASNRPLIEEELKNCFSKTDGLPVEIVFEKIDIEGNIFIPKSKLNEFRRNFYEKLLEKITKNGHILYEYQPINISSIERENRKTAVISDDFTGVVCDVAIYKPKNYTEPLPDSFKKRDFEKYVYYPAFCTQADEDSLVKKCKETKIDGVYVENYGGIEFAKANDLKIFGGAGLNFINAISVNEFLQQSGATYYAISKEANTIELKDLLGEQAFMLSSGDIKLMDLCYCPFGKTCGNCDKKSVYVLTDESGREFPVSRYVAGAGECRFEVYNCASLIGVGLKNAGQLLDLTVTQNKPKAVKTKDNEEQQKEIYAKYTSGHFKRGVL